MLNRLVVVLLIIGRCLTMDSIGEASSVAKEKEGWSTRSAEWSEATNSIDQKINHQSPDYRSPSKERPTAETEHVAISEGQEDSQQTRVLDQEHGGLKFRKKNNSERPIISLDSKEEINFNQNQKNPTPEFSPRVETEDGTEGDSAIVLHKNNELGTIDDVEEMDPFRSFLLHVAILWSIALPIILYLDYTK
ncbi:hypothetical protein PGT21_017745 [Puccinia graminis f. sp. tritici]|uniref:Uncharacterized protein n=1 Tax=Puccinia graminis f. sp. tritici TaxID=56615 RepID=A0A5B0LQ86_PUCGR|nr:hypothetical protein PGT21_017878 [Puccinia graminis f. sp. tritici]KAA1095971.1 hypothetical protein PGTUg99_036290 [Puccinia graminis f. sp. tritici]KAA1103428.1 hypothetical protein PGT21_017745 [Puccinia graminis f. sp. tritici]KAA1130468.1 hypothetical protein PGTUg99_000394 [Puccinia graminis f. sp. tritici]